MKSSALLLLFVVLVVSETKAKPDDPAFEIECFYQELFIPLENPGGAVYSSDKMGIRRHSTRDDDKELIAGDFRDNRYYTAFASIGFGGIGGETVTTRAGDKVTLELSVHDKSVPNFGRMKTVYSEVLIHQSHAQIAWSDYSSLSLKLPEFPSTFDSNEIANTIQISCATGERGFKGPRNP